MKKFRIYAWPAYSTRKLNPYNYIIYKHIEEEGYSVNDFAIAGFRTLFKVAFSSNKSIFHIHWPTSSLLATKSYGVAFYRVAIFYLFIKVVRLQGKKVFWTVHNFEEHEDVYPSLQALMNRILYRNVYGFISLNRAGLHIIKSKVSPASHKRVDYIQHPHYKKYYKNKITREDARKRLSIPEDMFVFLFAGQIRKYKNVPALIYAIKKLDRKDSMLIIAGKTCRDIDPNELIGAIGNAENIKLVDTFIEEDDLQVYFNASDLVVTPYSKIFNSGSVFLNLSFNKPILAPSMQSICEIRDVVGRRWIKTYDGEITSEVLALAIEQVLLDSINERSSFPDIEMFDPRSIAKSTIEFYKSFLN